MFSVGPLLFNIFINDLCYFFHDKDVCDYGDDPTFHACDNNLGALIERLECSANRAVEWFKHNYMRPDKCHLLVCGQKHECILINLGGSSGKTPGNLLVETWHSEIT